MISHKHIAKKLSELSSSAESMPAPASASAPIGKVMRDKNANKSVSKEVQIRWDALRKTRPFLQMIQGPFDSEKEEKDTKSLFYKLATSLSDKVKKYISLDVVDNKSAEPVTRINSAIHKARIFKDCGEGFHEGFDYLGFIYSKAFDHAKHVVSGEKTRLSNSFNMAFNKNEEVNFDASYITQKQRHIIILYAACLAVESDINEDVDSLNEMNKIVFAYEDQTQSQPPGLLEFKHPIFHGKAIHNKLADFDFWFSSIDQYCFRMISSRMLKDMRDYLGNIDKLEQIVEKYLVDKPANPVQFILENKYFSASKDLSLSLETINKLLASTIAANKNEFGYTDKVMLNDQTSAIQRQGIILALVIDTVREEYHVAPDDLQTVFDDASYQLNESAKKVELLVLKQRLIYLINSIWDHYNPVSFAAPGLDHFTIAWINNYVTRLLGREWEYRSAYLSGVLKFVMQDFMDNKDKCYAALQLMSCEDILDLLLREEKRPESFEMPKSEQKADLGEEEVGLSFDADSFADNLDELHDLASQLPDGNEQAGSDQDAKSSDNQRYSRQFKHGIPIEGIEALKSEPHEEHHFPKMIPVDEPAALPISFEGFVLMDVKPEPDAEALANEFEELILPNNAHKWCDKKLISQIEDKLMRLQDENMKRSKPYIFFFKSDYQAAKEKEKCFSGLISASSMVDAKKLFEEYKKAPGYSQKDNLVAAINEYFRIDAELENFNLGAVNK